MNDLQDAVKKNPPDIKLLQLLLQGSISTQVQYDMYNAKERRRIFDKKLINIYGCHGFVYIGIKFLINLY